MKNITKIKRVIKIMKPDSARITLCTTSSFYEHIVYLAYGKERFYKFFENRLLIERVLEDICKKERVTFFIARK